MLGFLKKLFGAKTEETVPAPYKVETPVVEATPTPVNPQITDAVTQTPVVETKPKKAAPKKKPAGQKPAGSKPTAPKQAGNRGRKPKAK